MRLSPCGRASTPQRYLEEPLSCHFWHDGDVAHRAYIWGGALIAVLALAALAAYLAEVGLDRAGKLSDVIGAFVALIGLAVSGYGMVQAHSSKAPPSPPDPLPTELQATKTQSNVVRDNATMYAVMDGAMNIYHADPALRPADGEPASSMDPSDPDEA